MNNEHETCRKTRRHGLGITSTARALLLAALLTLAGCQSLPTCPALPPMPAKPMMPSLQESSRGGIDLNRADTERLGRYIMELERGYTATR